MTMPLAWIVYVLVVLLFGLLADLYFSLHAVERKEAMPWPTCPSCHQRFNPAWVSSDEPDPQGRCWWCANGFVTVAATDVDAFRDGKVSRPTAKPKEEDADQGQ